jgi:hypothetical protein
VRSIRSIILSGIRDLGPIWVAAKVTRSAGTPLPRQGTDKWAQEEFLQDVVEKGGFEKDKIILVKADVHVTTSEITRYATMLWSFIGGTSTAGWLKSDEENWDRAVDVLKQELQNTDGYKPLNGGRVQLKFVANIAIATK